MLNESELFARLKEIKILIADVDGVLTDGKIIITSEGEEVKYFNVKDGMATKLLLRKGVDVAFITGRNAREVELRAKDLGVTKVYQNAKKKLPAFEQMLSETGLKPKECVYMGDDLPDLPVMVRAGIAIAVADAHPEVIERAHYVTKAKGGEGAVREVIDLILKAKGLWDEIIDYYLQ